MITTRQRLTRYSGSLAVVLGVHGLAILLALNWSKPQPMPIPPQAMVWWNWHLPLCRLHRRRRKW